MSCLSHPISWWVLMCLAVALALGAAVLFGAGYLMGLERQVGPRRVEASASSYPSRRMRL